MKPSDIIIEEHEYDNNDVIVQFAVVVSYNGKKYVFDGDIEDVLSKHGDALGKYEFIKHKHDTGKSSNKDLAVKIFASIFIVALCVVCLLACCIITRRRRYVGVVAERSLE